MKKRKDTREDKTPIIKTKRVVIIINAINLLNKIFHRGTALVKRTLIVFDENSPETKSAAKITMSSGINIKIPCFTNLTLNLAVLGVIGLM